MHNFTEKELSNQTETSSVYFMKFASEVSKHQENGVYCFVENYDMCYYMGVIKINTILKPVYIPCEGKKNVIQTHKDISINPYYNKYHKLFFVDADFDDNSELPLDIYITPCYSIENLYVSRSFMEAMLEIEYKIDPYKYTGKYCTVMELYENELNKFNQVILLFNSWYKCYKSWYNEGKPKVNLEHKMPSGYINLDIGNITQNYDLGKIENDYPEIKRFSSIDIEAAQNELKNDLSYKLRGKYEIQFLCTFLEFLNKDSRESKVYTVQRSGLNINQKTFISQFCQYADIPNGLCDYIKTGKRTTK